MSHDFPGRDNSILTAASATVLDVESDPDSGVRINRLLFLWSSPESVSTTYNLEVSPAVTILPEIGLSSEVIHTSESSGISGSSLAPWQCQTVLFAFS